MYKQTTILEQRDMPLRCMLQGSGKLKVGDAFTLRAEIRPFTIGGYQVILAKRIPASKGNRPGFILLLNGSCVEFWTFADGDDQWHIAKTPFKTIQAGEFYKIMVTRSGNTAQIFANGIDVTDHLHSSVSSGDVNNDVDAFVGFQVYDVIAEQEPFRDGGQIYMIGIYNDIWMGAVKPEVFAKNPNVIALEQLPEMKDKLKIGRKRAYG